MSSSEIERLSEAMSTARPRPNLRVQIRQEDAQALLDRLSAYEEALELIANYDANVTDDAGREMPGRPAVHPAVRSIARNALDRLPAAAEGTTDEH